MSDMEKKVTKSEKDWRKNLTPEEFSILRKKGTEPAFTGKYVDNKGKGIYLCAGCGIELFSSDTKFDSGSGWPSFWAPVSKESLDTKPDDSLGMHRTEVLCGRCGGHLGHVFEDGPKPSGQRFCINSTALHFKEEKKNSTKETKD
jgi:peptide-methionine (R)-S-oxide reductase